MATTAKSVERGEILREVRGKLQEIKGEHESYVWEGLITGLSVHSEFNTCTPSHLLHLYYQIVTHSAAISQCCAYSVKCLVRFLAAISMKHPFSLAGQLCSRQ